MTAIRKCHSSWDGHGPGNPILCRLLIEDPGFLASRSFALLKVLIFVRNVTTRQVRHSNSLNSLNSGSTYRVRHIGRRYPLARSRHACGTQDGSAQNRPYSVFNHVKGSFSGPAQIVFFCGALRVLRSPPKPATCSISSTTSPRKVVYHPGHSPRSLIPSWPRDRPRGPCHN